MSAKLAYYKLYQITDEASWKLQANKISIPDMDKLSLEL